MKPGTSMTMPDPYQRPYSDPPGYPPVTYGQPFGNLYPAAPRNGLGTAALVCGIVAVVFCWTFFGGWILGILSICFGGVGLGRARRGEATNRGSAIAGIVLGILAIALPTMLIVVGIGLFATVVSTTTHG